MTGAPEMPWPTLHQPGMHVVQAPTEDEARAKAVRLLANLDGGEIVRVEHRVTALSSGGAGVPRVKSWVWLAWVREAG